MTHRAAAARAAVAALVAGALFVGVTWLALESNEVARLVTRAGDGSPRATRVWVADHAGAVWIEAATPERPWYRDLVARPEVELSRDDGTRHYAAHAVPEPGGRTAIRALLRDKYGVADWWVGVLQDTSRSRAVRLVPLAAD